MALSSIILMWTRLGQGASAALLQGVTDRIALEIGKGGDKLIPSILGREIDQRDGEALQQVHSKHFKKSPNGS